MGGKVVSEGLFTLPSLHNVEGISANCFERKVEVSE